MADTITMPSDGNDETLTGTPKRLGGPQGFTPAICSLRTVPR